MESMNTLVVTITAGLITQVLLMFVAKWIFDIKERTNLQKLNAELLALIAKKSGVNDSEVNALMTKYNSNK